MRRVIWILVLLLAACPAEEGASSKRPSPARSSAPVEAPKGVGVFQFETSEDTAGFLVFFRSTTCTLAQAEAALREEGLSRPRRSGLARSTRRL